MENSAPDEMFTKDKLFSADGSFNRGILSLESSDPERGYFKFAESITSSAEMETGSMKILKSLKDEMNRTFLLDVFHDHRVGVVFTNLQQDALSVMRSHLAGERVKDVLSVRRNLRNRYHSGEAPSNQDWAEHVGWFFQSNAARQDHSPVEFNNDEIFEVLTGPDVVTRVCDAFPELYLEASYLTTLDEKDIRLCLTKH